MAAVGSRIELAKYHHSRLAAIGLADLAVQDPPPGRFDPNALQWAFEGDERGSNRHSSVSRSVSIFVLEDRIDDFLEGMLVD